ncbi:MAG: DUF1080 domain-containing protein [Planctomycetaceae bacterium]|nr:DUF1080 domain-containing protein [Planctomycetaceae bacterium]
MIVESGGTQRADAQEAVPQPSQKGAEKDPQQSSQAKNATPGGEALDKEISLLPEGGLSEGIWSFVTRDKDSTLAATWRVQQSEGESVLVCRGEPYGYLKTAQAFSNFHLQLEWKFPIDENGNSGILLYTNGQGKDKVWPTSIQVQLHQPECGNIFPSGDATSDNEIRDVHDVCKSVNQWNSCEITSIAGRISVQMNGREIGVVTGCNPQQGGIALQSEGSEVHFRRIKIRPVSGSEVLTQPVSQIHSPRHFSGIGSELPNLAATFSTGGQSNRLCLGLTYSDLDDDLVHRDALAADGHSLSARAGERLLVASDRTAAVSDRHVLVRSRHYRHLRR